MFYENVAIFDIVKESASLDNESSLFVTPKMESISWKNQE